MIAATISRMASSQAPKVLRLRLVGSNTAAQVKSSSKNNNYMKRYFSDKTKEATTNTAAKESTTTATAATTAAKEETKKSWWNNTQWWGTAGAMAGWGMSGAAIYDALESSPELISLNMTGVLIVYSSLFARWAFVVKPQNLLLAGCHVTNVAAQMNQLRRAVEYKKENGKDEEVDDIVKKAGATAAAGVACVLAGPMVQSAIVNANLGVVSTVAGAEAGPFTVHFWAPMSRPRPRENHYCSKGWTNLCRFSLPSLPNKQIMKQTVVCTLPAYPCLRRRRARRRSARRATSKRSASSNSSLVLVDQGTVLYSSPSITIDQRGLVLKCRLDM